MPSGKSYKHTLMALTFVIVGSASTVSFDEGDGLYRKITSGERNVLTRRCCCR